MNNPYIPNTASMPNILFDYWMAQLTDGEFKVLMAIARKTYGWHKVKDKISLKQIEMMTGLSRKGITKIIDSLVGRGLVIKTKTKTESGDDAPNMYEINVDCEETGGIAEGGGSELSTPGVVNSVHQGVVNSVHQGVVNSVHPQNPLYTKPNTTNKNIAQTAARLRKNTNVIKFSFEEKKFINITPEDIQQWKEIYTAVDVERELKKIERWALDNPTKSKPKSLWGKCISTWLSKEHDKVTNLQAYRSAQKAQVLERHTGFQKDDRPRDPSKTIKVGYGNPLPKAAG